MKHYLYLLVASFLVSFLAACGTAPVAEAKLSNDNVFSFSIDPKSQTVNLLNSQTFLQNLDNSLQCGLAQASILQPNRDLALSHYDFTFLPNNQLKIIAKFKNVSPYAYADLMFERVTGKQILSSTEPAPVALVASQEETAELEFLVHHKGRVFTYEVVAKAKVLCDTSGEEQLDFGDAPDGYGTTLASDGARHVITGSLIALGNFGESEDDGQPTVGADGDDLNGADDEDALTNVPALSTTASSYSIDVLVNTSLEVNPVYLVGWIDLNGNGNFDANEKSDVVVVTNGNNTLSWTDLSGQVAGSSYLRIRLSTTNGLGPTGAAPDGEVEDYPIDIVEPEPENGTIIIVNETIPDDPQSFSY
ncbi:MAG: hypothetical protein KC422_12815, partial [Trueperaceae bacterium]|nr:hypothetical protein [Trueperaceae bacterium]